MSSCRILLYKSTKILPTKNFKVDDIETYLSSLSDSNVWIYDGQYFKHGLEVKYKFDIIDENLEYVSNANWNYAKVTDDYIGTNVRAVYYFVVDKKWIATSTLELTLRMDVINTFAGSYTLSEKTTILRQHKNRYSRGFEGYYPLIDFYSENINPPLFKKQEKFLYNLIEPTFPQVFDKNNYYLMYYTNATGDNQAIDVYLTTDESIRVNQGSSGWSGEINFWNGLGSKKGAIIYGNDSFDDIHKNVGVRVTFKRKVGTTSVTTTLQITTQNQAILIVRNMIRKGYIDGSGFHQTEVYPAGEVGKLKKVSVTGLQIMREERAKTILYDSNWGTITESHIFDLLYYTGYEPPVDQYADLGTISDIDRTDAKIVKIVRLPYSPINLVVYAGDNAITIPPDWEIADFTSFNITIKLLRMRDTRNPDCFSSYLTLADEDYLLPSPFDFLYLTQISDFGKLVSKDMKYETKLHHSEFYVQKYVYDTFYLDLKLEFCEQEREYVGDHIFNFYVSAGMSSEFYFSIFDLPYKTDVVDFSNILYVSRNNELNIYNSAYLNYIRNGFNYDVKTKNMELLVSTINLQNSFSSGFANVMYGSGDKTSGAVNLITSALSKTMGILANAYVADMNIDRKLKEYAMQGVSVSGNGAMDLMVNYTGDNKLKYIVYEVSSRMKKVVYDLFYYFGYIANYQGIPETDTRRLFNFVQADVVFNEVPNLPNDIVQEIIDKWHIGITFIHHYTMQNSQGVAVSGWDFEQQYENWEIL